MLRQSPKVAVAKKKVYGALKGLSPESRLVVLQGIKSEKTKELASLNTKISDLTKEFERLEISQMGTFSDIVGALAKDLGHLDVVYPADTRDWMDEQFRKHQFDPTGGKKSVGERKQAASTIKDSFLKKFDEHGLTQKFQLPGSFREPGGAPVDPANFIANELAWKVVGLPDEVPLIQAGAGHMLPIDEIRNAFREMVLPPMQTPHNLEVCMMSLARFATQMNAQTGEELRGYLQIGSDAGKKPKIEALHPLTENIGWGHVWRESAFARLEIGHRLAAALMFTDIPEDGDIQAPWNAWSLLFPDGLLEETSIRRVWCLGSEPVILVLAGKTGATLALEDTPEQPAVVAEYKKLWAESHPDGVDKEQAFQDYKHMFETAWRMIRALVKGACLALSNPEDWKKEHWYAKPSGTEVKPSKKKELPRGERYVLGKAVQIDLREEVENQLHRRRGVGGSSPKVLFLVRGHWTRQVHGKGRLLRKTIWIEPFWKGEGRVLLRPYQAG
jgi:hypothetical protein